MLSSRRTISQIQIMTFLNFHRQTTSGKLMLCSLSRWKTSGFIWMFPSRAGPYWPLDLPPKVVIIPQSRRHGRHLEVGVFVADDWWWRVARLATCKRQAWATDRHGPPNNTLSFSVATLSNALLSFPQCLAHQCSHTTMADLTPYHWKSCGALATSAVQFAELMWRSRQPSPYWP